MRVVLDTDILISAFTFPGGASEYVYRSVLRDHITLITSPGLLAELGRILSEEFEWDDARSEAAITQIVRVCTVVRPDSTDARAHAGALDIAFAGRAQAVVSGDREILSLRRWQGIHIVTASTLLQQLPA